MFFSSLTLALKLFTCTFLYLNINSSTQTLAIYRWYIWIYREHRICDSAFRLIQTKRSLGIIYKCGGRGGIFELKLNAWNLEVQKETLARENIPEGKLRLTDQQQSIAATSDTVKTYSVYPTLPSDDSDMEEENHLEVMIQKKGANGGCTMEQRCRNRKHYGRNYKRWIKRK